MVTRTLSQQYHDEYDEVLASCNAIECEGCGASLMGDSPAVHIYCWNCYRRGEN